MNISKPPKVKFTEIENIFKEITTNKALEIEVKDTVNEYYYWDKVKQKYTRSDFDPLLVWKGAKLFREFNRKNTPIKDNNGKTHEYTLTDKMLYDLNEIAIKTSGRLGVFGTVDVNHQKHILNSLTEEAIASSQLEGASTSRKVAKKMILSKRKPRTHSEKMILNNYVTMGKVIDWAKMDMSRELLLSIQESITIDTLEDAGDVARFRNDTDEIIVGNESEVLYTPPKEVKMNKDIDLFIKYANTNEDKTKFVNPIIKASILHYWLSYIHPFCDGNGRTARTIFYWYLLKSDYWLFKYLSVSSIMKTSKKQYDAVFLQTQYDQNDIGYFIKYSLESIIKSISKFENQLEIWKKEQRKLQEKSIKLSQYNIRQLELIQSLYENPEEEFSIKTHMTKHQVVYQTARTDILGLLEQGLIEKNRILSKEVFYIGMTKKIEKLFL